MAGGRRLDAEREIFSLSSMSDYNSRPIVTMPGLHNFERIRLPCKVLLPRTHSISFVVNSTPMTAAADTFRPFQLSTPRRTSTRHTRSPE
jgi:hypothetical protein